MTSCDKKGNKKECLSNVKVGEVLAKNFGFGQWSSIGPGSEKKSSSAENNPQKAWDRIAEEMLLEFAGSGHPFFRATTPLLRLNSRAKDTENCRFTTVSTRQRLGLFLAKVSLPISSVFTEQKQRCVKSLNSIKDGSGEPDVLMGQSNCSQ